MVWNQILKISIEVFFTELFLNQIQVFCLTTSNALCFLKITKVSLILHDIYWGRSALNWFCREKKEQAVYIYLLGHSTQKERHSSRSRCHQVAVRKPSTNIQHTRSISAGLHPTPEGTGQWGPPCRAGGRSLTSLGSVPSLGISPEDFPE